MKKGNLFSIVLVLFGIGYIIAAVYPLIKSILNMNYTSGEEAEWVEVPMLVEE